MNLFNKGIVITCAASSMGLATANYLHSLGVKLCLIHMHSELLTNLASKLESSAFVASVTDEKQIAYALTNFSKSTPIYGLVNGAGVISAKRLCSKQGIFPLEEFQQVIDVNLVRIFNMMRLVSQYMLKKLLFLKTHS